MSGPVELTVDEDDWFGAGSSFDSGEELAAALFSMSALPAGAEAGGVSPDQADGLIAGAARPVRSAAGSPIPATPDQGVGGEFSTLVQPDQLASTGVARAPRGAAFGPVQRSGSGWRIREGVRSLRRAEDALDKLRQDAVVVTWAAASVAVRRARGDL